MAEAPDPRDNAAARKGRLVAVVIAVTGIMWVGAQAIGLQLGWSARLLALFDLAAAAAFLWALVLTYQIWRLRRGN